MLRFLRIVSQVLILVIVALASTLVSMRYAIHGREVTIPDFRGMSAAEAERAAFEHGLQLSTSDHFYSAQVATGRIISQQPEPGMKVRRGWQVQAADSLGPQLIEIPEVVGQSPRAAEINLRRRGLETGENSELPTSEAAPQSILAQTPSPGAKGVAAPRVSLLYAVATEGDTAFAMPDLTGMSFSEANSLVAANGLKTTSITSSPVAGAPIPGIPAKPTTPSAMGSSIIVAQTPAAGSRVTPGMPVTFQTAPR